MEYFFYFVETDNGRFFDGVVKAADKEDAYEQVELNFSESGYYMPDCLISIYTREEAIAEGFFSDEKEFEEEIDRYKNIYEDYDSDYDTDLDALYSEDDLAVAEEDIFNQEFADYQAEEENPIGGLYNDEELEANTFLDEGTEKIKDHKWVNRGKEGTHGTFRTKKEADAQRKAMFANGYKESLEDTVDQDLSDNRQPKEEEQKLEYSKPVNKDNEMRKHEKAITEGKQYEDVQAITAKLNSIVEKKFVINYTYSFYKKSLDRFIVEFYIDYDGSKEELEEELCPLQVLFTNIGFNAHAENSTTIECISIG